MNTGDLRWVRASSILVETDSTFSVTLPAVSSALVMMESTFSLTVSAVCLA